MTPVSVRIMVNVVWPLRPEVHHHLRPRSLEDKIRIKQMLIHSHVLLGMNCSIHNQGLVLYHHVSICNCSGYSIAELDEMVQEAYVDFLFATERYFVSTGFPLYPTGLLRSMIVNGMHAYSPFNPHPQKSCYVDFLKLINLTMIYKEVIHNHRDAGCGSESTGFIFNSPPFAVPVHYTVLPLATFRGL